ncbi:MAG TPA: phosphatase PAP2 family protein [Ilumatobacteraceae bacterium]
MLVIYTVYRELRVGVGHSVFVEGLPIDPFRHARTVLKVERFLWLDIEHAWQHFALQHKDLLRLSNAYYSWMHQIVTLGLVVAVLLKAPWGQARRWVAALVLQLPVALLLFRLYPLMPPRLLDAGAPWGGRVLETHRHLHPTGFVDTLVTVRGPWSPGPVALNAFTNQFAAMPSLHCAFALWVGVVWWKWAKGKSWRIVGPLHTAFIFWCVIVTGNHYALDAIAGWSIALATLWLTTKSGTIKRWAMSYFGTQGTKNVSPSTTSVLQ